MHVPWFHKKLLKNNQRQFCKSLNLFQIVQTVFVHHFGFHTFSLRKLEFDELKMIVKECQIPMLLVLTNIQSETQKHIKGLFPSVEGDEASHIADGTHSKCITIPFISDALHWCVRKSLAS